MRYIHKQKGADAMYKIWHSHHEYMFIYTYSDGGSIVSSEKMYAIKRGSLALVSAGKYHYTMPSDPERYERSKLFLSVEEANKLFAMLDFFDFTKGSFIYAALSDKEAEEAESIFESLNGIRDNGRYESAVLISAVCRLAMLLDKNTTEKEHSLSDFMSIAVKFINDNITEELSIDEIASFANVSKYHFCRTFKKVMGLTVMEYILKTRIMLAKNLLASSSKSILAISEECAFSGVSYFCRVFKDEVGISPLQYRKSRLP